MEHYAPVPFEGVHDLLARLHHADLSLGIVTSNHLANVEQALGSNMNFFDQGCVLTKDRMGKASKADALTEIVDLLRIVYSPSRREAKTGCISERKSRDERI